MTKKKIFMFLGFIFIVSLIIIGYILIRDLSMESEIKKELNTLNVLVSKNKDSDMINEVLNRRISKKEYLKVEDAYKKYYKDLYNNINNIYYLADNDNLSYYLDSENILKDKPDFIKTKTDISNSLAQLEEFYDSYNKMLEEDEVILSYIDSKDNYYINFYREILLEELKNYDTKEVDTIYFNTENKLDIYNEIINILITNKGNWKLVDNNIIFNDNDLFNKYDGYLKKLNNVGRGSNVS